MNLQNLRGLALFITVTVISPAYPAPVHLVEQAPGQVIAVSTNIFLVDFDRVAFGNLKLYPPLNAVGDLTIRFGEALADGRINRHPPGSVRCAEVKAVLHGNSPLIVAPPPNARNTKQPAAVLTPPELGAVLPFRWVEIAGWPGELKPENLRRRAAFASTWNDSAAAFHSSDECLNRIWELCRYSTKATTFAGIYVDGDRERIPYEADAYLAQINQYYTDGDVQMARDTFDRLLQHPTWPTEWAFHMIFVAHADWQRTGDTNWLAPRYAALIPKLLLHRAGPDGLLLSNETQRQHDDIVDWPARERDGFVFEPVNTVVNAFYLRSLTLMAELAKALGKAADAAGYLAREQAAQVAFQQKLFDAQRGLYLDGEGTDHASQHANLFPLAFGLVPAEYRARVTEFVASGGMECSVYPAQYLLEGLFENGAAARAIALITAPGDRSWRHMVESGTTITWEAWDQKYKPNLDWTHAWGAAPANLLPRFVLGAQPLAPGWKQALIEPHPGPLTFAAGTIPTPLGPVLVDWRNEKAFTLSLVLPAHMAARVKLPAPEHSTGVFSGNRQIAARLQEARWILDEPVSGKAMFEVRF